MKRLNPIGVALVVLMFSAASAAAQEQRPRNILELLFGAETRQTQQTPAPAAPRSTPRASSQASQTPPAPVQDKSTDAQRVIVFGDSMAVDIARALERLYADNENVRVIERGVGSSGFVRQDFFDWQGALEQAVAEDSFDVAVVIIGINDRQNIGSDAPLSDGWRSAYTARLDSFLGTLRAADKPVVWVELPPMELTQYGAAMVQISNLQKAAVQSAGGEWVETFERYMSESGGYTAVGPDLNGQIVTMRKADGIHFSAAGADKVAFYVDRAIGQNHGGGGSTLAVTDHLAGTDAANMLRPPFQGLGQLQFVDMASVVQQIGVQTYRANDLVVAGTPIAATEGFDIQSLLDAPAGRVDAFGIPRIAPVPVENPRGR